MVMYGKHFNFDILDKNDLEEQIADLRNKIQELSDR
jgi:hypothetical protein